MGVFSGLSIAFDLTTSIRWKEKQQLKSLIENNDGKMAYSVNKHVILSLIHLFSLIYFIFFSFFFSNFFQKKKLISNNSF